MPAAGRAATSSMAGGRPWIPTAAAARRACSPARRTGSSEMSASDRDGSAAIGAVVRGSGSGSPATTSKLRAFSCTRRSSADDASVKPRASLTSARSTGAGASAVTAADSSRVTARMASPAVADCGLPVLIVSPRMWWPVYPRRGTRKVPGLRGAVRAVDRIEVVNKPTRGTLHDRDAALAVVRLVRVVSDRLERDRGGVSALALHRKLREVDRLERVLLAHEVGLADLSVEAVAAEPLVRALRIVDRRLVEARDGIGGRGRGPRARTGGRGRRRRGRGSSGARVRPRRCRALRGVLLRRIALLGAAGRRLVVVAAAAAARRERDRERAHEQQGSDGRGRDPAPSRARRSRPVRLLPNR